MKPLMILTLCAAILCIASAKPVTRRELCDPRSSNYHECLTASKELCESFPEVCENATLTGLTSQHNEPLVSEESVETFDDRVPYEVTKPIQFLPSDPVPDYPSPLPPHGPFLNDDPPEDFNGHTKIPDNNPEPTADPENQYEDHTEIPTDESSEPTMDPQKLYEDHTIPMDESSESTMDPQKLYEDHTIPMDESSESTIDPQKLYEDHTIPMDESSESTTDHQTQSEETSDDQSEVPDESSEPTAELPNQSNGSTDSGLYESYESNPVTQIPGEIRIEFPGQRLTPSDIQNFINVFE